MVLQILIALAGMAPPQEAPAPPPRVTVRSKTFQLLRGKALEESVRGKTIFAAECLSTAKCTAWFSRDGKTLTVSGDRVPSIPGTYTIGRDRFCTTVFGHMSCKALYRSRGGEFVELGYGKVWASPILVVVRDEAHRP